MRLNNKAFIKFAKAQIQGTFIIDDAATVKLKERFDLIVFTSGYHHIKDEEKLSFWKNVKQHLTKEGKVVMYEKFVAPFTNEHEMFESGVSFYLSRTTDILKEQSLTPNQRWATNAYWSFNAIPVANSMVS